MVAVAPPRTVSDIAIGGDVDVGGLTDLLRRRIRGGVRFDAGTRALYSTDASNYRQVPIGVVVPRDVDDVIATVDACREFGAPVLSRGGGTSLAGESCNVAVVIDWSKHVRAVESIDPDRRVAVVQPGIVLDDLNTITRPYGRLVFGPKPATHSHCTIGGMIGNNSCGATAQWSGTTGWNVERMEILTYDGTRMWVGPTTETQYQRVLAAGGRPAQIYRDLRRLRDRYAEQIATRFPHIPRRISGFDLVELRDDHEFNVARALVGTEGTCVTVLRAELRLLPEPAAKAMVVLGYPDLIAAARAVPAINRHQPMILEGLDDKLIGFERGKHMHPQAVHLLPDGRAWLMVEFGADTLDEAEDQIRKMLADVEPETARRFDDVRHQEELWAVREAGLGATARMPGQPDAWPGWEDSAVHPDRLADYLRDLGQLQDDFGYGSASLYGHFGHGCVHTRIPFDLTTAGGIAKFRKFLDHAADLVVSYGGSLSGEHGDGQARGALLSTMYGDEVVQAFREFKAIFDPDARMNPGKVVDALPVDGDLRLGVDYTPAEPSTYFGYPHDDGSFSRAVLRCVGVGECRRSHPEGEVMCPSYQVTREEQHSTRGRARLLFEMLQGDVLRDGWRDEAVADALDLCLACKGCKRDCPMDVDMATYKAEFLSHHFAHRIRPRDHYTLGWLPVWAQLAKLAPGLANAVTHTAGIGALAKRVAGLDPQRDMPRFARASFTRWFRRRTPAGTGARGPVLLWPDTFTTHLDPGIAAAAVGVLEASGWRVVLPDAPVCCGLTWISTGQLGIARSVLRRTLSVLAPHLRAGTPIVGLEPSCTAVFRSDAPELLAHDLDVTRLTGQTRTLAELLADADDLELPSLDGAGPRSSAVSGIVQTHCHHHAVLGFDADREVMRRIGLDVEVLDSGCCGLAGNFGMTRPHRDVSLACAEQALLPAVRDADPATVVLADGFSCRTQIADAGTGRQAVHLAEIINAARRGVLLGPVPERQISFRPEVRSANDGR